jgi:type I restriction enzyme S subunit
MSEMVVPDGWEVKRLGVCCDVLDSQRVPLNSQERLSRKGVYPYYGANGVQGYIDDFIFEGESVLLAEDGGYFSEYATRPIANFVTGRYWVNNHAHILRAKSDILNRWIYYSLVHKNILKHINGGTRAKLNQSDLKEILVPLPPSQNNKR